MKHVEGSEWTLSGDLTIRGVTKNVDLDLEFLGEDVHAGRRSGRRLLGHG